MVFEGVFGDLQMNVMFALQFALFESLLRLVENEHTLCHIMFGENENCALLCSLQAVNQAGAGPHSEQVNFRTPATNPDPVSTLVLLDLSTSSDLGLSPSTCLHLKWEEPNSNGAEITSYVITLDEQTITVESGTCHLVTDLQPDSEYRYHDMVVVPSNLKAQLNSSTI